MGAGAPEGLSGRGRAALVIATLLGVAVLVVVLFVRVDTQSFRAKSGAMQPTIAPEERFTVNKEAYDAAGPQRRDIVVLHPPRGALGDGEQCGAPMRPDEMCSRPGEGVADVAFVKRVIGLPGERVRVVEGRAVINGEPLDEPYVNDEFCGGAPGCTFRGSITVPRDHYFLMGDNRGASDDSRFWGPVPRDQIVGRVDDCLPLGLRCKEDDRTG